MKKDNTGPNYFKGDNWECETYSSSYLEIVSLNIRIFPIRFIDFLSLFLSADINSIVNLQIAGEHGDCGPHKLDPGGFLYNPQSFMEKGSM